MSWRCRERCSGWNGWSVFHTAKMLVQQLLHAVSQGDVAAQAAAPQAAVVDLPHGRVVHAAVLAAFHRHLRTRSFPCVGIRIVPGGIG